MKLVYNILDTPVEALERRSWHVQDEELDSTEDQAAQFPLPFKMESICSWNKNNNIRVPAQ
jgi:hypothetical protein